MKLCSMLCGNLDGRGVWGRMNTCICMTESLCCSPEASSTMPQYKVKSKKKKKKKKKSRDKTVIKKEKNKNNICKIFSTSIYLVQLNMKN